MSEYEKNKEAEFFKHQSNQIIEKYKEKAGLNKLKFYGGKPSVDRNTVPSWLKEGEEWENPVTGKKWVRKNGLLSAGRQRKYEIPDYKKCPECEKTLESQNDINVRINTGRCIKCHATDETQQLATKGSVDVPEWRKDILIKNSMGKIVMNFDEYHKEYGDEMAYMFVNNLVKSMDYKKEQGMTINMPMYENAVQKRDALKEIVNEKVNNVKGTVERLQKEGKISDKMTDEDVQRVMEELETAKLNNDAETTT